MSVVDEAEAVLEDAQRELPPTQPPAPVDGPGDWWAYGFCLFVVAVVVRAVLRGERVR